ncbi:DNA polymerase Y family protein (plasmid) [Paracoccus liaowanqingii]|uniref:DNA polymerase Y family protein n=1 Tax=Paracoccus liaowanqingii TaxID=2560053 RepID=A0A4Y5SSZ5_9RHOB|nr:DNA polymerase Y family protein [Paracoccus liaowanqingii]QDA35926.1 DNA polymerase Y family protein [Paracoccus liaowanqingii]
MARVISVCLPMWPIDRLRRLADSTPSAEAPLILVGRVGNRRVVTAACEAAMGLGLRIGMPVSKAQALVPDLRVEAADPRADLEALERLGLWLLQRIAPIVEVDPPDGVVIDVTGADHLHGGEEALLEMLLGRLTLSGITARLAIADTWGAAHALARHHRESAACIALPGATAAVLAPLPLTALRLPQATVAGLQDLGFATIGDLMDTPRAPLTLRFGAELCRRLDQALGEMAEPIDPLRPASLVEVRRSFAEPIAAAETIARYIGKLVVDLCTALEARGEGARRLDLLCWRVDNRIETVRVGLAVAQRDPKRLTRLLCDKIPGIDPGFGIEIITLTATLAEPLVPRQASSLLEQAPPDISDLVDMLANRVGHRSVYRLSPVASDVPERSVARIAALSPDQGLGWPGHWPRPSRLLPRPEPIDTLALLPDHPPNWISWRGIRHRVRRADRPERIFGEWWKRDAEARAVRDYFRIEDEAGQRFWIFRAGDGEDAATGSHRWFIHGMFG